MKTNKRTQEELDVLYGWIFTLNPSTGYYRACTRDEYLGFFSKPEESFLRSKDKDALEEIIIRRELA